MNPKLQLISLTLTNVANADSEVNLLSSQAGTDNNAFDSYYRLAFQFDIDGFLFRYTLSEVSNDFYLFTIPSIDSMVLQLNNEFLGDAIFSYELNGSAPNYFLTIRVTNSNFIPYALITLE